MRLSIFLGVPPKVEPFSHSWSREQNLPQVPKARWAHSSVYFNDLAEVWRKLFTHKTMTNIATPTSLDCIVPPFFPDPFLSIHLNCMYGLLLSSHSQGPPNRCCRCWLIQAQVVARCMLLDVLQVLQGGFLCEKVVRAPAAQVRYYYEVRCEFRVKEFLKAFLP